MTGQDIFVMDDTNKFACIFYESYHTIEPQPLKLSVETTDTTSITFTGYLYNLDNGNVINCTELSNNGRNFLLFIRLWKIYFSVIL